jgi:hypothetical protein
VRPPEALSKVASTGPNHVVSRDESAQMNSIGNRLFDGRAVWTKSTGERMNSADNPFSYIC